MNSPRPYIDDGSEKNRILPKADATKVQRGIDLDDQIKALQAELKTIKSELADTYEPDTVLVIPGMGTCTVGLRETVSIADADALAKQVGMEFDSLVKSSTTFKPTPELKARAEEDEAVAQCLAYKFADTVVLKRSKH